MTWTLALTADLHWGHRRGEAANDDLVAFLHQEPPEVLVLAGDIGAADNFSHCLERLADLPSRKVLIPGNHDLWVPHESAEDSLQRYRETLPRLAQLAGFHYLDASAFYLPEADLALVGTINWYDYSWASDRLKRDYPEELDRLQTKRFCRGRHNDANFIRWPTDDVQFTADVVASFDRHLQEALERAGQVIVVTHHPPFPGLSFPNDDQVPELDALLWDAFSGNQTLEELLTRHAQRIAFAFCGHTHRAREATLGPIRGYNIGGDYHFKRLLRLAWPAGTVQAQEFHGS
jgi:predicted phosphohydrolase